eukprot:6099150-Pleurochrysis_carterae.AAC.1
MLLEHQRLCDIADAAAEGRPLPPDHPSFAIPRESFAGSVAYPSLTAHAALVDAGTRAESA